jgi:dTDP-4-dehydrorhamnose 3,5-epimerase
MNVVETSLPGVKIIEPKIFGDARGFFVETWQADRYRANGLPSAWVQDNLSRSCRGVLRGLHYQYPQPQGKLVYVLEGEVLDVAVDIRVGSPTFGQSMVAQLSGKTKTQIYLPPGFAHGFYVLSETALFAYKCTTPYAPQFDRGILWNDPDLKIDWPTSTPSLSAKDEQHRRLCDVPRELLPPYPAS